MGDVTLGVILLLLTGFLWFTGAVFHWHNIRRQEKLVLRLRRLAMRRAPQPEAVVLALPAEPERPEERLRAAKRWTVG